MNFVQPSPHRTFHTGRTIVALLIAALTLWAPRPLASADADASLLAARAHELWASGLFAESEALARLVLARDEDQALAHLVLARALAARLALDEAATEVLRAIAADPSSPMPYALQAEVSVRLGHVRRATSALSTYLGLVPAGALDPGITLRRAELRVLEQLDDLAVEAGELPSIFSCDHPSPVVIPIDVHDGRPYVRGRINDGPERVFLVDTGADRTVLGPDTPLENGIEPVVEPYTRGSVSLAAVEKLTFGDLELRHVPAFVRPVTLSSSPSEGHALSPLALGLSMTLDFERGEMIVGQLLPEEPADIVVPLWFAGLPMIRGMIEGNRYMFIVDTGSVLLSVDAAIARDFVPGPFRRVPLRIRDGWGRLDPDAALRIPGPELTFGDPAIADTQVGIRNLSAVSQSLGYRVGGLIGVRVLSRFRVTFDLARRQLRLTHRRDLGGQH